MVMNGKKCYLLGFTALFNAEKEYILSVNCHQSVEVHTEYTFSAPVYSTYDALVMNDVKEGRKVRLSGSIMFPLKEGEIPFVDADSPSVLTSTGILTYLSIMNQNLQSRLATIDADDTQDIKAEIYKEIKETAETIAAHLVKVFQTYGAPSKFGVRLDNKEGVIIDENILSDYVPIIGKELISLHAINRIDLMDHDDFVLATFSFPIYEIVNDEETVGSLIPNYGQDDDFSVISEIIYNTKDSTFKLEEVEPFYLSKVKNHINYINGSVKDVLGIPERSIQTNLKETIFEGYGQDNLNKSHLSVPSFIDEQANFGFGFSVNENIIVIDGSVSEKVVNQTEQSFDNLLNIETYFTGMSDSFTLLKAETDYTETVKSNESLLKVEVVRDSASEPSKIIDTQRIYSSYYMHLFESSTPESSSYFYSNDFLISDLLHETKLDKTFELSEVASLADNLQLPNTTTSEVTIQHIYLHNLNRYEIINSLNGLTYLVNVDLVRNAVDSQKFNLGSFYGHLEGDLLPKSIVGETSSLIDLNVHPINTEILLKDANKQEVEFGKYIDNFYETVILSHFINSESVKNGLVEKSIYDSEMAAIGIQHSDNINVISTGTSDRIDDLEVASASLMFDSSDSLLYAYYLMGLGDYELHEINTSDFTLQNDSSDLTLTSSEVLRNVDKDSQELESAKFSSYFNVDDSLSHTETELVGSYSNTVDRLDFSEFKNLLDSTIQSFSFFNIPFYQSNEIKPDNMEILQQNIELTMLESTEVYSSSDADVLLYNFFDLTHIGNPAETTKLSQNSVTVDTVTVAPLDVEIVTNGSGSFSKFELVLPSSLSEAGVESSSFGDVISNDIVNIELSHINSFMIKESTSSPITGADRVNDKVLNHEQEFGHSVNEFNIVSGISNAENFFKDSLEDELVNSRSTNVIDISISWLGNGQLLNNMCADIPTLSEGSLSTVKADEFSLSEAMFSVYGKNFSELLNAELTNTEMSISELSNMESVRSGEMFEIITDSRLIGIVDGHISSILSSDHPLHEGRLKELFTSADLLSTNDGNISLSVYAELTSDGADNSPLNYAVLTDVSGNNVNFSSTQLLKINDGDITGSDKAEFIKELSEISSPSKASLLAVNDSVSPNLTNAALINEADYSLKSSDMELIKESDVNSLLTHSEFIYQNDTETLKTVVSELFTNSGSISALVDGQSTKEVEDNSLLGNAEFLNIVDNDVSSLSITELFTEASHSFGTSVTDLVRESNVNSPLTQSELTSSNEMSDLKLENSLLVFNSGGADDGIVLTDLLKDIADDQVLNSFRLLKIMYGEQVLEQVKAEYYRLVQEFIKKYTQSTTVQNASHVDKFLLSDNITSLDIQKEHIDSAELNVVSAHLNHYLEGKKFNIYEAFNTIQELSENVRIERLPVVLESLNEAFTIPLSANFNDYLLGGDLFNGADSFTDQLESVSNLLLTKNQGVLLELLDSNISKVYETELLQSKSASVDFLYNGYLDRKSVISEVSLNNNSNSIDISSASLTLSDDNIVINDELVRGITDNVLYVENKILLSADLTKGSHGAYKDYIDFAEPQLPTIETSSSDIDIAVVGVGTVDFSTLNLDLADKFTLMDNFMHTDDKASYVLSTHNLTESRIELATRDSTLSAFIEHDLAAYNPGQTVDTILLNIEDSSKLQSTTEAVIEFNFSPSEKLGVTVDAHIDTSIDSLKNDGSYEGKLTDLDGSQINEVVMESRLQDIVSADTGIKLYEVDRSDIHNSLLKSTSRIAEVITIDSAYSETNVVGNIFDDTTQMVLDKYVLGVVESDWDTSTVISLEDSTLSAIEYGTLKSDYESQLVSLEDSMLGRNVESVIHKLEESNLEVLKLGILNTDSVSILGNFIEAVGDVMESAERDKLLEVENEKGVLSQLLNPLIDGGIIEFTDSTVNVTLDGLTDELEEVNLVKSIIPSDRNVDLTNAQRRKRRKARIVKHELAISLGQPDDHPLVENVFDGYRFWLITGKPYAWNNRNWAKTR
jgi:hypothetical protein